MPGRRWLALSLTDRRIGMRGPVILSLVMLLVGCGGTASEELAESTATLTTVPVASTASATPPATTATATQTLAPTPNPTATRAAPTPIVMGTPAADLPTVGQFALAISVGVDPSAVAVGHGAIWVQSDDDGILSRIDPATNAVVATIQAAAPVDPAKSPDDRPHLRLASPDLAIDARSVWAIMPDEQAIAQVDPQTNTVIATIPLPAKAMSIAVHGTSLWVALFGGSGVARIDTVTREVVATIGDLTGPFGIAVDQEAVWVSNFWDDRVIRIDPTTNQVAATIPLHWRDAPRTGYQCSLCATDVLVDEHGVWVTLLGANAIARIDPATNQVAAFIPVGTQPISLASDAHGVWVGHESTAGAYLIDPATNQVVAAVPVPDATHQLTRLGLSANTLWAIGLSSNEVVRIDLQPM
jgi:YVTN family beta-propeller protein